MLSIAVINPVAEAIGGGNGLQLTGHHGGRQGRNLEARTDTELMEKRCFLPCSQGLLSLLSYSIQDHVCVTCVVGGCTIHNSLGPPSSIINQENAPNGNAHWHFLNPESLLAGDPGVCHVDGTRHHKQ